MCGEYRYLWPANGCLPLELQKWRDMVQSAARVFLCSSMKEQMQQRVNTDGINESVIRVSTDARLLSKRRRTSVRITYLFILSYHLLKCPHFILSP